MSIYSYASPMRFATPIQRVASPRFGNELKPPVFTITAIRSAPADGRMGEHTTVPPAQEEGVLKTFLNAASVHENHLAFEDDFLTLKGPDDSNQGLIISIETGFVKLEQSVGKGRGYLHSDNPGIHIIRLRGLFDIPHDQLIDLLRSGELELQRSGNQFDFVRKEKI